MDKPTPAVVAHTPGPYKVTGKDAGPGNIPFIDIEAPCGQGTQSIAHVQATGGGDERIELTDVDWQTALLISAAPDMLAALKETTALLERICIEEGQWPEEILAAAHAAIAKAEKGA